MLIKNLRRMVYYSPDGDSSTGEPAQGAPAQGGQKVDPAKGGQQTPPLDEQKGKGEPTPKGDPNAAFLEELNRLAQMITNPPTQGGQQTPPPTSAGGQTPPAAGNQTPQAKPVVIPEGDDFSEFINDPGKFKAFMGSVIQQAKEEAKNEILKEIPKEMKKVVREEISFDRAASDFWLENNDLLPAKPFLAARASIIAAQNPSMSYKEVFDKAGKEVRASLARLGIKEGTEGTGFNSGTRPAGGGNSGKDDENDVKKIALSQLKLS